MKHFDLAVDDLEFWDNQFSKKLRDLDGILCYIMICIYKIERYIDLKQNHLAFRIFWDWMNGMKFRTFGGWENKNNFILDGC